jgi:DNA-binding MarR family transcriptional regulator
MSNKNKALNLTDYYPYRLAVLSHEISKAFTPLYQQRFQLSRQEWRVLAALGEHPNMSSKEITEYSTLEKMQVSRAFMSMTNNALIEYVSSKHDRREKRVKLSDKGIRVYKEIVPHALAREKFILSSLTAKEIGVFDHVIDCLTEKARQLQERE